MADDTFTLGRALGVVPDAVGQPGNRRFRILARNDIEQANLWLERQQLEALAEAIKQLGAQYPVPAPDEDPDRPPREGPLLFDRPTAIEFQVGDLALGFDEQSKLFVLIAKEVQAEDGAPPTFTCLVSREQLAAFSYAVHGLSASGRQRCPICGRPIDGAPHDHAGSNGHHKE